ncbi:hypothetical protein PSN45_000380 [Yamadazyma tenuis]|uniref:Uncharacterized protein n=1 Tax=Candida tenuis (strain ATCC 10573 / BCRC 21748 / CBS 615 / JCM 9827 / NBRC 10315 / NRRL Y-1498 / VKM Y-70) TaxID=590646 RepID=G3B7Z6_CANTC|nr:uncharacterized protein CANTEDRAFT_115156 [Yamadazyma tenuis ATCC 10573]EGV62617.1 hypothetical protein CANTEDRAFT_115156 [Yamadazyma tenuis ATCC 10573]WEJ92922.1 hypothetical protein PSN45_000380 [Yamadazyma tenuis]
MNDSNKQQELLNTLLQLAEKEKKNGNTSITQDKLNNLSSYIINHNKQNQFNKFNTYYPVPEPEPLPLDKTPTQNPINKYSPLFKKFTLPAKKTTTTVRKFNKKSTFKKTENLIIGILETLANILDNLHLFSKFPMFPQKLLGLLKQTNKLWILILIFLIRKTVSQLLNLIKKENKIKVELKIVKESSNKMFDNTILKKYEKVLKDLKFDKTMLILELFGNFLDLGFNFIESYGVPVPDWFMNILNFSSMFMTIYRMNKDDEYIDDDVTEELI